MSEALVRSSTRSHATFARSGDPWPTIAAWAQTHRFLPREPQTPQTRMFQKGSGFWTAPMRAQFTIEEDRVHVQAWIHVPLFTRVMSLFLLPQELPLESGGFRAAVPRRMARKAVNELLAQVGAPPIP